MSTFHGRIWREKIVSQIGTESRQIPLGKTLFAWSILAGAAALAVIPLWLILTRGVNVPFWDDWDAFIIPILKIKTGQMNYWGLINQHNEHRIFFPRLIAAMLSSSDFNMFRLMWAEWILVCLTSLGILRLLVVSQSQRAEAEVAIVLGKSEKAPSPALPQSTRGGGKSKCDCPVGGGVTLRVAVAWLLCNLFIFSPHQWENWIWAMGFANVMPMAFIVTALVVATSDLRPYVKVILAAMCCGISMYSSGNGLLSWFMVGPVLAWNDWQGSRKSARKILAVFCVAAVILTGLYFVHFDRNVTAEGASSDPMQLLVYGLVFLGGIANWANPKSDWPAGVFGATVLAMYVFAALAFIRLWMRGADRRSLGAMLVWLMIGAFALGSAAMATPRRAGFGAEQAATPRYISFSLYLPVSLIVLIPMICKRWRDGASGNRWRMASIFVSSTVCIGLAATVLFGFSTAFAQADTRRDRMLQGKAGLLLDGVLPNNEAAKLLYPRPNEIFPVAEQLNQMGLMHFEFATSKDAREISVADANLRGAMMDISNTGGEIKISGWVLETQDNQLPDGVLITCDDSAGRPMMVATAKMGVGSYTLVAQLGSSQRFQIPGWSASVDPTILPPNISQAIFHTWVLNSQTGKATELANSKVVMLDIVQK